MVPMGASRAHNRDSIFLVAWILDDKKKAWGDGMAEAQVLD